MNIAQPLILAAAMLPSPPVPPEPVTVTLSPAEAEVCQQEGGCVVVTRKVMHELIRDAKGCWRPA